jgi:hypothetical protein
MISRLELRNIEARRYAKPFDNPAPSGQVRIDHNSTVTLMSEAASDEAYVEFVYTTSYGPLGVIKVDGALVYKGEGTSQLVAAWKETRRMPNDVASKIHTTVMHACVPEAVNLAKLLRLPPPIPLPQVRFQQDGGAGTAPAPAGPEFG